MKRSKNYKANREKIDRTKKYPLEEAVKLVKEASFVKFDESVEIAARLGVNPKHADQMVRGTVALPHGTGKKVKVLAFCTGDKEKEAADKLRKQEMVEKVVVIGGTLTVLSIITGIAVLLIMSSKGML